MGGCISIFMDKSKTHHKNRYVVNTELDEDAIVLNPNDRYYYNFNETELGTSQIMEEFQSLEKRSHLIELIISKN
jgi:hypothetical protein